MCGRENQFNYPLPMMGVVAILIGLLGSSLLAQSDMPELVDPLSSELVSPDGPVSEALRSAELSLINEDRNSASQRLVNTLGIPDDETGFFSFSIPEPATAGLIGLAALLLFRYRNRARA